MAIELATMAIGFVTRSLLANSSKGWLSYDQGPMFIFLGMVVRAITQSFEARHDPAIAQYLGTYYVHKLAQYDPN